MTSGADTVTINRVLMPSGETQMARDTETFTVFFFFFLNIEQNTRDCEKSIQNIVSNLLQNFHTALKVQSPYTWPRRSQRKCPSPPPCPAKTPRSGAPHLFLSVSHPADSSSRPRVTATVCPGGPCPSPRLSQTLSSHALITHRPSFLALFKKWFPASVRYNWRAARLSSRCVA